MDMTRADDIALPTEVVELQRMRTKSGEPVRVLCESVNEMSFLAGFGLPGQSMSDEERQSEAAAMVAKISADPQSAIPKLAPIIEAGTALAGPDGAEIRPAFWFSKPVAGAIPGRFLQLDDMNRLVETIMRLSGYGGGAAAEATFPDGERAGRDGGVGVAHDGEVVRVPTLRIVAAA